MSPAEIEIWMAITNINAPMKSKALNSIGTPRRWINSMKTINIVRTRAGISINRNPNINNIIDNIK